MKTTEEIAQMMREEDHEGLDAMHEAIDAGDEELEGRFFDAVDILCAEEAALDTRTPAQKAREVATFYQKVAEGAKGDAKRIAQHVADESDAHATKLEDKEYADGLMALVGIMDRIDENSKGN